MPGSPGESGDHSLALAASHGKARHAALTERSRETADLTLRLLEFLAVEPAQCGVTELALAFDTSKATIHRHLRTLANREFVRQDPLTSRYEPGVKLFQLGERLRDRFGVLGAARSEMVGLRDATGQAVTLSTLVEGKVVVLDLVPGHSVVEFGIRPGTQMGFSNSAHGKAALAFGPPALMDDCLRALPAASSGAAAASGMQLKKQVTAIKRQGWATAANEVVFGINALAAPLFDHRGAYAGAIAIVGSTQFIASKPEPKQLAQVTGAAARISAQLGWRET